jgi:hypothetical protein
MSERGAYVLSLAILVAAGMLAFASRRETAQSPPAATAALQPGPVVQTIQLGKDGRTVVLAVFPDGRYITWKQFGNDQIMKDESGVVSGK